LSFGENKLEATVSPTLDDPAGRAVRVDEPR
jgi:hypothetical protein